MSDDIASRLRTWTGLTGTDSGELMDEAADEIERLRAALEKIRDKASGSTVAEAEANAGIFVIADNALKSL
jgi:hypothetical protein